MAKLLKSELIVQSFLTKSQVSQSVKEILKIVLDDGQILTNPKAIQQSLSDNDNGTIYVKEKGKTKEYRISDFVDSKVLPGEDQIFIVPQG